MKHIKGKFRLPPAELKLLKRATKVKEEVLKDKFFNPMERQGTLMEWAIANRAFVEAMEKIVL